MEIKNVSNIISSYRSVGYENDNKKISATTVKKAKNVDKVEFSSVLTGIDLVKANAVNSAESSASEERISAIKSAIREGSYVVSAEKIANAIING